MKMILVPFIVFAFIGFICSLIGYITTLFGGTGPFGPPPTFLDIGIVIMWIPTVIAAHSLPQNLSFMEIMKLILNNCPRWMKYMLGSIITYDLICVLVTARFYLKEDNDRFVLWYTQFRMTFYALAWAILVSTYRTWKNYDLEPSLENPEEKYKAN